MLSPTGLPGRDHMTAMEPGAGPTPGEGRTGPGFSWASEVGLLAPDPPLPGHSRACP